MAVGQFNFGFKPKLGLSLRMMNVDMHSPLFTREEVEAIPAGPENGRAHLGIVHPSGLSGTHSAAYKRSDPAPAVEERCTAGLPAFGPPACPIRAGRLLLS